MKLTAMSTPRTPAGLKSHMSWLLITFNQPRKYSEVHRHKYSYSSLARRAAWNRRDPRLTGELLLAALCENA